MSTTNLYRVNAEDCLRLAKTTSDEREKPFWLALAQSWLHLAEHSAREGMERELERPGADAR